MLASIPRNSASLVLLGARQFLGNARRLDLLAHVAVHATRGRIGADASHSLVQLGFLLGRDHLGHSVVALAAQLFDFAQQLLRLEPCSLMRWSYSVTSFSSSARPFFSARVELKSLKAAWQVR